MNGMHEENTSRRWSRTRLRQPTRNILRGFTLFVCLTYQDRKVVLGAGDEKEQSILYENASKNPECIQTRKRSGRLPKYPQGADYVYVNDDDCRVREGFPLESFQRMYAHDYKPDNIRDIIPAVSQILRWLKQQDSSTTIEITAKHGARVITEEGSVKSIEPVQEGQHED